MKYPVIMFACCIFSCLMHGANASAMEPSLLIERSGDQKYSICGESVDGVPGSLNIFFKSGELFAPLTIDDILVKGKFNFTLRFASLDGETAIILYDRENRDTGEVYAFALPQTELEKDFFSLSVRNDLSSLRFHTKGITEQKFLLDFASPAVKQVVFELAPVGQYLQKQEERSSRYSHTESVNGFVASPRKLVPVAEFLKDVAPNVSISLPPIALFSIYKIITPHQMKPVLFDFDGRSDTTIAVSGENRFFIWGNNQNNFLECINGKKSQYRMDDKTFSKIVNTYKFTRWIINGQRLDVKEIPFGAAFSSSLDAGFCVREIIFENER